MRFLFVDRISQLIPGKRIQGIKHITLEDTYLVPDAKGRLQFIPSLIGETLGQLAAWNVMFSNDFTMRPVAGLVSKVSLHRPAYLGDTLELEAFIDQLDDTAVEYHGVVHSKGSPVLSVEGAVGPLLPMNDFIDQEEVRRQFNELCPRQTNINHSEENVLQGLQTESIPTQILGLPQVTTLQSRSNLQAEELIDQSGFLVSDRVNQQNQNRSRPVFSFDRILSSEPGISLIAEKRITRASPYFLDHFPRKPVLPMTVLLACKLNLAYELLARASFNTHYEVRELRKIKMNEFVYSGDVIQCHVKVKQQDSSQLILSYRSEVEGKRVCVVDIIMKTVGD